MGPVKFFLALRFLQQHWLSIWNVQGPKVFDSDDQFEQLIKDLPQAKFNDSHSGNERDDRSDHKVPQLPLGSGLIGWRRHADHRA
jgi:hypothetical protein